MKSGKSCHSYLRGHRISTSPATVNEFPSYIKRKHSLPHRTKKPSIHKTFLYQSRGLWRINEGLHEPVCYSVATSKSDLQLLTP